MVRANRQADQGSKANVAFTIVTSIKPERLSKRFSLSADGSLLKSPGGNLVRGNIEVRTVESLSDLAMILKCLTPAQALVYGVPKGNARRLMTRKAFELAGKPAGATTRTNDGFAWPDGPSVLMLDYDPPAGGDALGRGALVRSIREAAPGLADAAMLWWPSASSDTGEEGWQGNASRGDHSANMVDGPARVGGGQYAHRNSDSQ
jgi:hypothetical protein